MPFLATAIGPEGGAAYKRGRKEAVAELCFDDGRSSVPPTVRAKGYIKDGAPHLSLELIGAHPERRVLYDGPFADALTPTPTLEGGP